MDGRGLARDQAGWGESQAGFRVMQQHRQTPHGWQISIRETGEGGKRVGTRQDLGLSQPRGTPCLFFNVYFTSEYS